MASIAISASLQRACNNSSCSNSNLVKKKQQQLRGRRVRSLETKQAASHVVTVNVDASKGFNILEQQEKEKPIQKVAEDDETNTNTDSVHLLKFNDARWKNGTWDLNMFVKNGKMDWDGVIVAEARRRKFLEMYPESATNEEPVMFRSSIIPWWAWLTKTYLPEAELLNGRAAMVGFFMAYAVDALTGLDVVGQTGNFICKVGVFVTVIGIILFKRTKDIENLKNLADEATLYDKQWQASWEDQNANSVGGLKDIGKKF